MKSPLVLLALLLAQSLAAATPPPDPHRVTGIITIDGRHVALIELADGSQQRVRPGDSFAGGTVLEITRHTVRIGFDDAEQTFSLRGDPNRPVPTLADTPAYVRSPEPPASGTGQRILKRDVVGTGLEQELTRIAADLDRNPAPESATPEADPDEPSEENPTTETTKELTRLIGPLVNLPADAQVVGINHQPVTSTREGIAKIQQQLSTGNVVTLMIYDAAGKGRIYVMPDRDGK